MSNKCYEFKADIICKGKGYIFATDVEEAERLIMDKDWDDLDDLSVDEVVEITEIKEER